MSLGAQRPRPRKDIVVSELGDEGLAYDFSTHRAHCLSPTAYAVFRRCDGATSFDALVRALVPGNVATRAELLRAVEALIEAGLIDRPSKRGRVDHGRRRMLQKLALTAATPLVWSIVAPSVAEAASKVACFPPSFCMSAGTVCCGTSGSAAMTCSGNGQCNGAAGLCAGTCQ